MFDVRKLKNRTGATLSYRNRTFGPHECFDFKGETGLIQSGAATFTHEGRVVQTLYISSGDQPGYDPSRPEVHRYFYPTFVNGGERMRMVPKAVLFYDTHAEYGEVLFARYYFWCDFGAINSLTASDFTVDRALSKASDVVTEVFPLPEEEFVFPVWRPLPEDFNLRTHRSRKDSLVARA